LQEGPRATVVVAHGDPKAAARLGEHLLGDGLQVMLAGDAEGTGEVVLRLSPGVVLVDRDLPGAKGTNVCRSITSSTASRVIIVGGDGDGDSEECEAALAAGADDYVRRGISQSELVARVRAALRRISVAAPVHNVGPIQVGELVVDPMTRTVSSSGREVCLTPTQFDLLLTLLKPPRQVWSRQQLAEAIWGPRWFGNQRVVDVHISHLRRALAMDPRSGATIRTVRGVGYMIQIRPVSGRDLRGN
jgi:DNA-binding response OmpR family regulator